MNIVAVAIAYQAGRDCRSAAKAAPGAEPFGLGRLHMQTFETAAIFVAATLAQVLVVGAMFIAG